MNCQRCDNPAFEPGEDGLCPMCRDVRARELTAERFGLMITDYREV